MAAIGHNGVTTQPLSLAGFLPVWDVEKRSAPFAPIIDWTLDQLRNMGHRIERLEDLHHHLAPTDALATAHTLSNASMASTFRMAFHKALVVALDELPISRVWIQTRAHYRILLPGDTISPVPPHTDFGFGHRLIERNLWISLTDARGNAALHVHSLADSLAWMAKSGQTHGVFDSLPDPPPVPTQAGDMLLFTPLHIHRAKTPDQGQSRVSIDVRIVPCSDTQELTYSPFRIDP